VESSHRGLRRVASFRPYKSIASRRHRASWVGTAEQFARAWVSFFWALGTVKTVTSHKCGPGWKSQIPIEICARTHWAAPPRDLTAGDQLYATNSVLPESRAASASHATNSILPESQAASASHATNSVFEREPSSQRFSRSR